MTAPWFDAPPVPAVPSGAPDADDPDAPALVRPYVVTAGRTGTSDTTLHLQTVVTASSAPERTTVPDPLRRAEHAHVAGLCDRPRTVVQVALALQIPFGVALVLIADLLRAGALDRVEAAAAPAVDVTLLERLRAGVAAL